MAFSEAQQGEIESALARLGAEDGTFRNRLEAEYEREEHGQFCGLFVKNLENVQGDERDIILLSVCYGYDRSRRMLMNFGPINQRGGEKRLNVIFSRSRRHMAVISSIHHHDITNDYNDGAACLRAFLEYAAACSTGDLATSRRVLHAASPAAPAVRSAGGVAEQLAAALRERGLLVEPDIGQSTFRLPLAARREGDDGHSLGLLLDDDAHYAQRDLLERYLLRPGVLRAFGWRAMHVFTKEWLHDPAGVLRRIEEALAGVGPEPGEAADESATTAVAGAAAPVFPATSQPDVASAPAVSAAVPADAGEPPVARHFVCTEDGASKFWEVTVAGRELTVRFGRVGTKGQTQAKSFASAEAARHEEEKLIRSKLAKGYAERSAP